MRIEKVAQRLADVRWIGGATDAGKSTIAAILSERLGARLYTYDRRDLAHHQTLAESHSEYEAFLRMSMDERWVDTTPIKLFERALTAAQDRFPLVIDDLLSMADEGRPLIAEGFGLLPKLVAPLLTERSRAIWLLPSDAFKRSAMRRRSKGNFGGQVSDPARATANLVGRDALWADEVLRQCASFALPTLTVDEGTKPDDLGETVFACSIRAIP